MNYRLRGALLAFCGLFLMAVPAPAHHSFQAEFDEAKQFELTGVLTKVDWINPHIRFYMDVKGADGKVTNWALTTVGPSVYHKAGLARNFVKVGETYTVTLCAGQRRLSEPGIREDLEVSGWPHRECLVRRSGPIQVEI